MVDSIRTKIRALVTDISKSGFETFTYTTSNVFTVAQENITITEVLKDSVPLDPTEYSFDSVTNKITITPESGNALISGDIIEVDYTYYKYSNSELNEYIRASLVWISVFSAEPADYELDIESANTVTIDPTPDNQSADLISLVASILIKPDYSQYNLPNLKVVYPRTMTKEVRIEKLIGKFNIGIGINQVIQFDIFPNNIL